MSGTHRDAPKGLVMLDVTRSELLTAYGSQVDRTSTVLRPHFDRTSALFIPYELQVEEAFVMRS
jgi:hypothetical protein